jgi:Ni,Fe-hydrogenase maturation factor
VSRVVVVIGVGNEYRRDDGAGLAVVTSLRDRVPPGWSWCSPTASPPG